MGQTQRVIKDLPWWLVFPSPYSFHSLEVTVFPTERKIYVQSQPEMWYKVPSLFSAKVHARLRGCVHDMRKGCVRCMLRDVFQCAQSTAKSLCCMYCGT